MMGFAAFMGEPRAEKTPSGQHREGQEGSEQLRVRYASAEVRNPLVCEAPHPTPAERQPLDHPPTHRCVPSSTPWSQLPLQGRPRVTSVRHHCTDKRLWRSLEGVCILSLPSSLHPKDGVPISHPRTLGLHNFRFLPGIYHQVCNKLWRVGEALHIPTFLSFICICTH